MRKNSIKALMLLLVFSFSSHAEVLLIDRVEAKAGVDVPTKSTTMNQVRANYGDPIAEHAAVGNPPITRWDYPTFVVYFEHQHVITTVLKKSKPTEIGPDSID